MMLGLGRGLSVLTSAALYILMYASRGRGCRRPGGVDDRPLSLINDVTVYNHMDLRGRQT